MRDEIGYVVPSVVGCLAGVLNVIAGRGSFLALPILIFLGLPAGVVTVTILVFAVKLWLDT